MKYVILYVMLSSGGFGQHEKSFDTLNECEQYATTKLVATRSWACIDRTPQEDSSYVPPEQS